MPAFTSSDSIPTPQPKSRLRQAITRNQGTPAGSVPAGSLVRFLHEGKFHFGMVVSLIIAPKYNPLNASNKCYGNVRLLSFTNGAAFGPFEQGEGIQVTPLTAGDIVTLEAM